MIEDKPYIPDVNFPDEQEDFIIAMARLEDNLPSIPLSEVLKQLGLEEEI